MPSSRSSKEEVRRYNNASPGVGGALKDAIKSIGDSMGNKAVKVPDKDGKPVKPRTLREKQMEDLGI